MTHVNYLNSFTSLSNYFQPKELSEEEYCAFHFGSAYLGNGMVKCDYCCTNQVKITGYFNKHVCAECKKELENE